ncbi:hypothetical protein VPH35_103141 [Triticum aestivum]
MTSSSRRHGSSSAAPLEDENLLPEILLRLPPQPSSLPRASLVCKRWRRLASDPGFLRRWRRLASDPDFLRRFRIHHRRSHPLLGSFVEQLDGISFLPTLEGPNRVPPGRFSLQFKHGKGFMLLDCRHGLLRVAVPAGLDPKRTEISGAVLRATGDVQHFQVVCVATRCDDIQHGEAAVACVYSSETDEWGIVEFNFETQSLAVTRVPHVPNDHFKVIRADSGGLCFLYMSESDFTVQLWKPETNCDILGSSRKDNIFIVGFAEENSMVLLRTLKGLYAVHLQSLELKNLPETNGRPHYYPFESVYIYVR